MFLAVSFLFNFDLLCKFEVNSLRNNGITMALSFLAVVTNRRSEMTSYLNNGYDFTNYFAKFEKFLLYSIIMPSFMTVGSQMPELGQGKLKNDQYQSLHFSFMSSKKGNFVLRYFLFQFSFHLIMTSYTKFELSSLRNNGITMTLPTQ